MACTLYPLLFNILNLFLEHSISNQVQTMKINFTRLNHIQICISPGEEDRGREFYCDLLGLKEIEKPERMKKAGGFWVEIADIQIHIGTENLNEISIRHPAFEVNDIDAVKQYLIENNIKIIEQQNANDYRRFSFFDYWDNRIELMEKV